MPDFPLFHGSCSRWIDHFVVGEAVKSLSRDYLDECHRLRLAVSAAVTGCRLELNALERRTLEQSSSEQFNWQHGQFYLTPSFFTASNYARGGMNYGGEFVQILRGVLGNLPEATVEQFRRDFPLLSPPPEPWQPLVVEFADWSESELASERPARSVEMELAWLRQLPQNLFEAMSQQANFRVVREMPVVTQVHDVSREEGRAP